MSTNQTTQTEELDIEDEDVFALDSFVNDLQLKPELEYAERLTIDQELQIYRGLYSVLVKDDFQQFWNDNSNLCLLKEFAIKYNTICATSVPSECAFSVAGNIDRKERARLSSKMLRFTILLKERDKIDQID